MATAKKAKRPAAKKAGARSQDAIALLKEDHTRVRGLLDQLDRTTERSAAKRLSLLAVIEGELKIHTTIEEEIFYPAYLAAAKKKDDKQLFFEATEEHHVVDLVLPEIKQTDPATETFAAKATVLKELVEHHAGEEEKEMFPKARKAMSKAELVELGARMQRRKEQLLGRR